MTEADLMSLLTLLSKYNADIILRVIASHWSLDIRYEAKK